jgi:cytochrome c oxidase cbb3-type subunit IV
MKFINYLEKITGVGIYPMVSLLIFFVFFVGLTFWALKANKRYISEMKNIPFTGNEFEL